MKSSIKTIVTAGLFAAISIVLMVLIRIPFPPAPFLEYDPADIPIIIASFLLGPYWGVGIALAVSVIQGFTLSASSGVIGAVMHFAAAGSFALITGIVYRKNPTTKGSLLALILGSAAHTVLMAAMNLLLTPVFMKTPSEAVLEMMIPIILPYNIIKVVVNSIVVFLLFKAVEKAVRKFL